MIVGWCGLSITFEEGVVVRSCPSTSPHEIDEIVDVIHYVRPALIVHKIDKSSKMTFQKISNTFLSLSEESLVVVRRSFAM